MHHRFLAILVAIATVWGTITPVTAATMTAEQDAALRAALAAATLANSPPVTSGATYTADPNLPQIPSFSYPAGTPLPAAIPAGLLMMMGSAKNYSPDTAIQDAGGSVMALAVGNLDKLPFIGKLPLAAILTANPQLTALAVNAVFPDWNLGDPTATIGSLASSALGSLPIPSNILANTPIANLPGITSIPFGNYPGIGLPDIPGMPSLPVLAIDLPGIPDLSLDKLVTIDLIPSTMQLVKIDTVHTEEPKLSVAGGINVASGSNKEPHAPCTGNCSAVELLSAIGPHGNFNPIDGAYSIIGQRLKGGQGLLGDLMTAAGIREPAGFEVPYIGINGCGSKWSAESPNAAAGTIQQQLNLRFCYTVPFLGFQASPYFIPIPLPLPASEKQANLLLPMIITPATMMPGGLPSLPSLPVPSLPMPSLPGLPGLPSLPSIPVATLPASLLGSNTISAWSPTLNATLG